MKAMVLTAPGELAAEDVVVPANRPAEVLVRITHTGLCGTDLKIYTGAIPVDYPLIMGHEVAHMSSVYREGIDDERLRAVAEHVRNWLFGPA